MNKDIIWIIISVILVFLAIREFNTWYWKINKRVKLLEKLDRLEDVSLKLDTIIQQLNIISQNNSYSENNQNNKDNNTISSINSQPSKNNLTTFVALPNDLKNYFEDDINEIEGFTYTVIDEEIDYNNLSSEMEKYLNYIKTIFNSNAVPNTITYNKKIIEDNWYYIEGEYVSKRNNKKMEFSFDIIIAAGIYYGRILRKSSNKWSMSCTKEKEEFLKNIGYYKSSIF